MRASIRSCDSFGRFWFWPPSSPSHPSPRNPRRSRGRAFSGPIRTGPFTGVLAGTGWERRPDHQLPRQGSHRRQGRVLDPRPGAWVDRPHPVGEDGQRPLLFLYVEEGESGPRTAFVHLRSSPWRMDWTITLPEPADEPLLADGFIYVGGWGFVSKVDMKTGKFAWVHRDLYRPPEISGRSSALAAPGEPSCSRRSTGPSRCRPTGRMSSWSMTGSGRILSSAR